MGSERVVIVMAASRGIGAGRAGLDAGSSGDLSGTGKSGGIFAVR